MDDLQLTLAAGTHDRTQLLWDGRVNPNGWSSNYLVMKPMELFFS